MGYGVGLSKVGVVGVMVGLVPVGLGVGLTVGLAVGMGVGGLERRLLVGL